MTEEEYFRKNYPDSCWGDRPLSPYWDYFQSGVEFGERQSEKKIADLERKLEQTEKDLADYQFNYPTIKELQEENAELKAKNKWYSEQVCNKECAEVWGQLTNAKEMIKELNEGLDKLYLSGLSEKQIAFIEQLQDKAEQFYQRGGEMKRFLVKRPKDTVEVLILPNKDGSGYQYINLTKGHICPCKFENEFNAIWDMQKKIDDGSVVEYQRLGDLEVK